MDLGIELIKSTRDDMMSLKFIIDSRGKVMPVIIADSREQAEAEFKEHPTAFKAAVPAAQHSIEEGIKKLAVAVNVTDEQLKSVFEFANEKPILIAIIEGMQKEKMKKICLVILTAYEFAYGEECIMTAIMKSHMEDAGVTVSTSFGSTLTQACKGLIITIGTKYSPNTAYKLTTPGRKEGLRLIKELAEGVSI